MPSPSSSQTTLRADLGASFMEFDLEMQKRGYIAYRVLPILDVMSQAGKFGKIPIEQLLKSRETKRAPGSGYNRGDWKFETATFATEEHGFEEPVDDREAAMYRDYFDAEQMAAMQAYEAVLQSAEQRVASLVFNATTWTPTAVTNEWDDAANAVPITDVETAVQAVYTASGIWPNSLIINKKVFRNLRNVAQIVDRLKYQGFVDVRPGEINEQHLSAVFDLQVIVAGMTKNTAIEGQAASLAPIWSDEYAMVARIAETNDPREPCLGRTFHWNEDGSMAGGTIETYRDETRRSDIVRVRHDVDEQIIHSAAGHLLSNITT